MRVVVAHAPDRDIQSTRQVLLGAGLECEAADCVNWNDLASRLARTEPELIALCVEEHPALDWQGLSMALELASGNPSIVAVGSRDNADLIAQSRELGATEYLSETGLREELDRFVERITANTSDVRRRGIMISVLAPVTGSGGSTVAVNLAGTIALQHPDEVVLCEYASVGGDVALLLDATPPVALEDVCRRWRTLDRRSLRNSTLQHSSGLNLLIQPAEAEKRAELSVEATRRIAVLSRLCFRYSLFALTGSMSELELETLRMSDAIVFILRADVPGIRRARRTLAIATTAGISREQLIPVVNRYGQRGQLPLAQIQETLGFDNLLRIPDAPSTVNRAANQGVLIREISRTAWINRSLKQLAHVVMSR